MPLFDAWLLGNSEPTHVARVHDREAEYRGRPDVKARAAANMRRWAQENREHLKAYKREWNARPDVRKRHLRYLRGYRQRPEVIEKARQIKARLGHVSGGETVSLDAIAQSFDSIRSKNVTEWHERIGSQEMNPEQLVIGASSEASGILAGLSEEDIDRMSEDDLIRLRERLIETGATPSTQVKERARQRHLVPGKRWAS